MTTIDFLDDQTNLNTESFIYDNNFTSSNNQHQIFNQNPNELFNYMNSKVEIKCLNGNVSNGYVFTVDPVSNSFILASPKNDCLTEQINISNSSLQIELVIGHNIAEIKVLNDDKNHNADIISSLTSYINKSRIGNFISINYENNLKEKLMKWLNLQRIPYNICEDNSEIISVQDVLLIKPPYTPESCESTNQIVLDRIQNIIKAMNETKFSL